MGKDSCLIISPFFAPMRNGLGHYSFNFYQELKKHCSNVKVICNRDHSIIARNRDNSDILPIMNSWKGSSLTTLVGQIKSLNPENLLIQYTPQMYGRAGLNLSFCITILILRVFSRKKISIMLHELYYPLLMDPKSWFLFFYHYVMLFILCISSKKIFTSTKFNRTLLIQNLFVSSRKVETIPVGATIIPHKYSQDELDQIKKKLLGERDKKILVTLGSFHASKNFKLLYESLEEASQYLLVVIGNSLENIDEEIGYPADPSRILSVGSLSDEEVSGLFQIADAYIGYFSDGVSERRSTVLSALAHGLPVISTDGQSTSDDFQKFPFIQLLSCDPEKFNLELTSLLKNFDDKSDGNEIVRFYLENFSLQRSVSTYYCSIS